ncbi:MAG: shikimate kinase [Clostridia bacterium]|nr:shikimate kinase [Clostridia bacterium]
MNIVLIGMPGCGKSTVGVLLAKALLFDFIDTDLILQSKYGDSLCNIIEKRGLDFFKKAENEVLSDLKADNSVIATGGSAVYCKEGMKNLRLSGKIVYLKLLPDKISKRIHNIKTRGIAMETGYTINDLYTERAPLYEHYSDITIDCTELGIEDCVLKIKNDLGL